MGIYPILGGPPDMSGPGAGFHALCLSHSPADAEVESLENCDPVYKYMENVRRLWSS